MRKGKEKRAVVEQLDVREREKRERARGLQSSGSGSNGRRKKKREERPWRRFGVARVMEWGPRFLRVPNCAGQVSRRRSASTPRV
jgi:hypothetical protein